MHQREEKILLSFNCATVKQEKQKQNLHYKSSVE